MEASDGAAELGLRGGENVNTAPKVIVTETSTCLCDGKEGIISNRKASLK